ncbi:diaminohydroxyphosphoribosylaminopyrimidine deaminase [Kushneria marisflavi]|uniref:Riboflavin biosynthesis protein RibD n=2 Tax=Kushneria marisflavi TaxID=157779 RepID=A0A240USA4_9GAMM|nr:riboflavin biosynthesis protein RibD [Kushneria marisflavi]RKD85686.1 diaminohydroxyphosphoribosylaminopyrimidine deaminase [Kushneria marisflavi]
MSIEGPAEGAAVFPCRMEGSSSVTRQPEDYMARALHLARRGLYTTDPNPRVGCVLVRGNQIVGEGWHELTGEPHAEIHALRAAGEAARGATAYVTLEPCSHYGRTGPCAKALAEAGVDVVVAAMLDPNPQVSGRGIAMLEAAGVGTQVGMLEADARELNVGFISRMSRSLPHVRLKMAMSLDGRTAMASGESKWITGERARRDVQHLRARSSAILSGVASVIRDDSRLTVRMDQLSRPESHAVQVSHERGVRQPLRVIVDSTLSLPPTARCLTEPGRTLVATVSPTGPGALDNRGHFRRREALVAAGAEVVTLSASAGGQVDLEALMHYLADVEQCNEVLLESGSRLSGAMLDAGLVNELVIYMAPILMGDEARGLLTLSGLEKLSQRRQLSIVDVRAFGPDWRIIARPVNDHETS